MEVNNYFDEVSRYADQFTKVTLEDFVVTRKLFGTEVKITRIKEKLSTTPSIKEQELDRYNKVLKGSMNVSSTSNLGATDVITTRIVFNKSNLYNLYNHGEDLECMDSEKLMNPNDLIEFEHHKMIYKYKVNPDIKSFGIGESLIHQYILNPIREYTNEQST